MANPVIKLAPIRMVELTAASGQASAYLPPHLRTAVVKPEVATVGNDAINFPALGTAPKKSPGWKQVIYKAKEPLVKETLVQETITEVVTKEPTMNDKIKDLIHQAALEEEERQKPKEDDPLKMTREELLADGWVILSLKSANEARLRLNTKVAPAYVDSTEI